MWHNVEDSFGVAISIITQAGQNPVQPRKWNNADAEYVAQLGCGAVVDTKALRLLRDALMHEKLAKTVRRASNALGSTGQGNF